MTVPSYTEEDVELVAEATEQHHIEFGITDAMGNNPCSCGQWWDAAGDNPGWDQHMAEVALATLAAAGRLVPPGSETREEFGVRYVRRTDGEVSDQDAGHRQMAEGWVEYAVARSVENPESWLLDASLISRRVITTPWSPSVPDTKEET